MGAMTLATDGSETDRDDSAHIKMQGRPWPWLSYRNSFKSCDSPTIQHITILSSPLRKVRTLSLSGRYPSSTRANTMASPEWLPTPTALLHEELPITGPTLRPPANLRYTESGHGIRPSPSERCPGLLPLEPARERPPDEGTRREVSSVLMSPAPTFQKKAGWRMELTDQSRRDAGWGEGRRTPTGPRPTARVPGLHLTSASGGWDSFPCIIKDLGQHCSVSTLCVPHVSGDDA